MSSVVIFGANSAIAQAVARVLAADGARFHLVGRDGQALSDIEADLKVRGASAVTTRSADLSQLERLGEVCDEAEEKLDDIDIALIAHGILPDQPQCEVSMDAALAAITVNASSPSLLMLRLAQIMKKKGRGTLVVLSSVAGDRGRPSNYVYGASKASLSVMGEGMALALKHHGVNVVVVKPGFVDTKMTTAFPKGPLWAKPEAIAAAILQAIRRGASGTIYAPAWWRMIMTVVKLAPGFVVKRL